MDDLITVCRGKSFKVMMTKSVSDQFVKVDARERARCQKWMERYAEDGHANLDAEKFKHEGRFTVGDRAGTKVAIYTFKAWAIRVYGGVVKGNIFVATEIDVSKKQYAADRAKLARAAERLARYM